MDACYLEEWLAERFFNTVVIVNHQWGGNDESEQKDGTDESAKDITYAEGVDVKVSDFTYTVAGTVAWASGEKYTEPEKAPVKVDTPSYYETDSFAPIGSDEDTFTVEITYVGPGSDNAQPVVVTVADEVGITQPASDENWLFGFED